MIAVITINLMNSGIATAQKNLEVTMARNEVDAQAEALRFIHNSYLAERNLSGGFKQFRELWNELTRPGVAQDPSPELTASFNNMINCEEAHDGVPGSYPSLFFLGAFVLNTRLIQPQTSSNTYEANPDTGFSLNYHDLISQIVVGARDIDNFRIYRAPLYPRILYGNFGAGSAYDPDNTDIPALREQDRLRRIVAAEGIWVIAMRGGTVDSRTRQPEYYDFHIRTCWHSVGRVAPSTIGTIVRLYNPDFIEGEAR